MCVSMCTSCHSSAAGEPAEAELGDEAILEGGPEALDAALGLG